ncbi:MAG: hypothetical protein IKH78_08230 [Ruminococcus sp.]|uniref:hypothetical protein n=1 Tax=Ralstonia pseudosolanacearum TaxID=1310165 RepID=UPI003D16B241|nr:hypothetical protein [Ruminococcus sp.]
MITLEQAKEAWEKKTPVLFDHPMMTRPIVCTIGGIEFSKRLNRVIRLTLKQPPTESSYIRTYPAYVFLPKEKPRFGAEVTQALEELGKLKEKGCHFDD